MNIWPRALVLALVTAWLPPAIAQQSSPPAGTAPAQRKEMQKEVGETADAIRGYSIERRKEAVARAHQSLMETDRRMEQLQTDMSERWSEMSASARQHSQAALADLRQRRNDVAEWTGGMNQSSKEVWDDVKAGFVDSYRAFNDALHQARADFDRDSAQIKQKMDMTDKTSAEKQQEQER